MTSFNRDTNDINDVITSTNTTNSNSQSNSDDDITSTTNINFSLEESEALQIATDAYKKAYNLFSSEEFRGLGNYNIVVNNVELQSSNKINISLLNNVFSDNAIKNITNSLVEYNGEYYDASSDFLTSIEVSTIFRTQAGDVKPLSLKVFNDECIVATGQIQNSNDEYIMTDDFPYYIVFVKENGKWLIDYYQ